MNWYRLLLRAYPRAFRERFGHDLEELFRDMRHARTSGTRTSVHVLFWLRITIDTLRQGFSERLSDRRQLPLRVHRAKGPSFMFQLFEDARHAVRALRHQPTVSLVVVLTLTLAIGANSAIFTVVNAVLLRPLPYVEPQRVMLLLMTGQDGRDRMLSIPDFVDFRAALKSIAGLSVLATQTANLTGEAEPDRLRAGFVTADFFATLGVQPIIGRAFAAGEDLPGAHKTALLEYEVWQRRFGADPAIVGRRLILNNEPHEVIGILPASFEFPMAENEVWLPFSSFPVRDNERRNRSWIVVGRVPEQVTIEQADAEIKQVAASLAATYPESNAGYSARLMPLHDASVDIVSTHLRVLMGAVLFVLLIACANIANLLLARAAARQREIALRAALGASRARMVRQLLLESTVLALTGGVLGLLVGGALTDSMLTLLPLLPRAELVRPDGGVLVFTAVVSLVTGLLFGLAPAVRLSTPDLRATLNEGARGGESRATSRVRSALVVIELALSLVLVAGAGLFIQSLTRLTRVELGYNPHNVLTLEYRLPRNKYPERSQQFEFHRRVIERIEALPGVQTAAIAGSVPQSGNASHMGYWRSEDAQPVRDLMPNAQANVVSPGYFDALQIPVLEGRVCDDRDREGDLSVIVNRMLAERTWPGESAVGKRLRSSGFPGEAVVIGVVGNTRPNLLSQPISPQLYGCLSQSAGIFATVIVRTAGEPMGSARSVQQAIWAVDPDQPMWKIRTSESMVSASVQRQRFVMLLMLFAAVLAMVLAAVGTYSVLSYTVQRRAREVGIRLALGATRTSVIRLVLGETAALAAIGLLTGVAGALAMGRVVASQLYEVSPRDPYTLAATTLVLAAVAMTAAFLPMRRAAAVDPIVTLRAE